MQNAPWGHDVPSSCGCHWTSVSLQGSRASRKFPWFGVLHMFLWLHCYPRLYRSAIQMFMRLVQNLDFQSGLKYLKGAQEISADVRSAEIETFHFMCLLCMTYLLIHCYFSYLLWPSEVLMPSDLGSASAIKTSLALSCCLGEGSWIDGKSSLTAAVWPHEGFLWLLLAQGSAVMTVFMTFGKKCLIPGVCRWLVAWTIPWDC